MWCKLCAVAYTTRSKNHCLKSCKCMPETSLTSMKSKVTGHHVCSYLKNKNYDHKCRENWKWVKSGQNKMFCGQGQSVIFTFSNAELLVIEACINSLNTRLFLASRNLCSVHSNSFCSNIGKGIFSPKHIYMLKGPKCIIHGI